MAYIVVSKGGRIKLNEVFKNKRSATMALADMREGGYKHGRKYASCRIKKVTKRR